MQLPSFWLHLRMCVRPLSQHHLTFEFTLSPLGCIMLLRLFNDGLCIARFEQCVCIFGWHVYGHSFGALTWLITFYHQFKPDAATRLQPLHDLCKQCPNLMQNAWDATSAILQDAMDLLLDPALFIHLCQCVDIAFLQCIWIGHRNCVGKTTITQPRHPSISSLPQVSLFTARLASVKGGGNAAYKFHFRCKSLCTQCPENLFLSLLFHCLGG